MSDNENNNSEVARLKQQISAEYESARRAMQSPAYGTASHAFISARMERMGEAYEALREIDENAVQFLVETMDSREDADELQRLIAEFNAIPSYFERFARKREGRDGKE